MTVPYHTASDYGILGDVRVTTTLMKELVWVKRQFCRTVEYL